MITCHRAVILCCFVFADLINTTEETQHCHSVTGRCYWLGTGSKTWDAARTACQSEDGDVAVMETRELGDYVKNLFNSRYLVNLIDLTVTCM